MRDHVHFYLNGLPHVVRGEAAFVTFSEYLRDHLQMPGTKVVCAEGDCGACTVLVGRWSNGRLKYVPVDCCIQFVHQLDGTHVITVEGLSQNGELHPVQQAMVDCHGSQCGYCTPGIVMALAGWAEAGARRDTTRIALSGNLCRCTGYQPIFAACESLSTKPPAFLSERFDKPELVADICRLSSEPVRVTTDRRIYFAPTNLADAVAFKAEHPHAVIVAGATELGVWRNKRGDDPPVLLSLARIADLNAIDATAERMAFGANVTWARIEDAVRDVFPEFVKIIERFGSPQIREVATLAGNVANGSPISDSIGLLLVMDAELEIAGPNGTRRRPVNGFYSGYKKKDLAANELITRIILPLPGPDERIRLYKVSRRNDLDIATFGAAVRVIEENGAIRRAAIAYSGVAATVVRLPKAETFLVGQPFEEATFRQAGRVARAEVQPITDVRGSSDFRLQLAENILPKFYFNEIETLSEALA